MGLKINKPRGRNGGRPRKLNEDQRRALGRYAFLLKRGAPVPSYELPSTGADDEWPLSDAAIAIVDAQALVAEGDCVDAISVAVAKTSRRNTLNKRAIEAAYKAIAANIDGLDPSDLRERQLRRVRGTRPEVDAVGLGPTNPHWCTASIEWSAKHLGVKVGGSLVREAEREYRQMIDRWDEMADGDHE